MLHNQKNIYSSRLFKSPNSDVKIEIFRLGKEIYNVKDTSGDYIKTEGLGANGQNMIEVYISALQKTKAQILKEYERLAGSDGVLYLPERRYGGEIELIEADIWYVRTNLDRLVSTFGSFCCNDVCKNPKPQICGGHVVTKPLLRALREGEEFYLVPLCTSCNNYKKYPPGVAMRVWCDIPAVKCFWD